MKKIIFYKYELLSLKAGACCICKFICLWGSLWYTCIYFLKDGVSYCDDGCARIAVNDVGAEKKNIPAVAWTEELAWALAVGAGGANPENDPNWPEELPRASVTGIGGDNCGGTRPDWPVAKGWTSAMNGWRGAGGPYSGAGAAKSGGPYTCAGEMGGFAARGGAYWPDI
jgi:hypothetical protein